MADEELERILRVEIPPCFVEATERTSYDVLNLNGWRNLGNVLLWDGSIDLSGYALDRKTFYPSTAIYQQAYPYINFGGSSVSEMVLVTSIPISDNDLVGYIAGLTAPGFTQDDTLGGDRQQDWTTVLFGQTNVYMINSTLPTLGLTQLITSNKYGSLSPSAADKLYIYKLCIPGTVSGEIGDSLSISSSRVIIPGSMMQEPKLEYMMRLKRSYELANQV